MFEKFTKADLKNGMIVQYRCGSLRKYIDGHLYLCNVSVQMTNIDKYNDNLSYLPCGAWIATDLDIVKVYVPKYDCCKYNVNGNVVKLDEEYELIWERKEDILTKEEKEYLAAVIKPVRDKVNSISLSGNTDYDTTGGSHITVTIDKEWDYIILNDTDHKKCYKGMEIGKRYTLEELGL